MRKVLTLVLISIGWSLIALNSSIEISVASPIALCQDQISVTLDINGEAIITPAMIDAGSYDPDGPVLLSVDPFMVDCSDINSPVNVVLTVTDLDGNTSTCQTTVHVEDKMAPVAICVSEFVLSLDENGEAYLNPTDIGGASYDNCTLTIVYVENNHFTCNQVGDTQTVQVFAVDTFGNQSSCFSSVIIQDNTPPEINCALEIHAELDDTGNAVVPYEEIILSVSDNCQYDLELTGSNEFGCEDIGENQFLSKVTDGHNEVICQTTIIVSDNQPPVPYCNPTVELTLADDGKAILTEDMVDLGSYDNCGILQIQLSKTEFNCDDAGTQTVQMTVFDFSGNSAFCEFNVVIQDNDCDGVADECDVCPGADDSVDNNNDGIADCAQILVLSDYHPSWICDQRPGKEKINLCHNGNVKCVKLKNVVSHLEHGDFLGPCSDCPEPLFREGGKAIATEFQQKVSYENFPLLTPNPSNGLVIINRRLGQNINHIELVELSGRVVHKSDLNPGDFHITLPFHIPNGVYLVRAYSQKQIITERLIIQR